MVIDKHTEWLAKSLKQVDDYVPQPTYFTHRWTGMQQAQAALTTWNTGVDLDLLKFVASKSINFKDDLVSLAMEIGSSVCNSKKEINFFLSVLSRRYIRD